VLHLGGDVAMGAADDAPVADGLGTAGLDPGHELAEAPELLVVVADASEPAGHVRATLTEGAGCADLGEELRYGGDVGE